MPMTEAYGFIADRHPREPAPLLCEGTCKRLTMHIFVRAHGFKTAEGGRTDIHDCYKCSQCQHERIWG